jgi:hypothetical protein
VSERDDVLSSGHREQRRRAPAFIAVAVCVIAAVAYGAVAGDRALRRHEFKALLAAASDGQATALHADAVVESTRQYAMPLIETAPAKVRAGLTQVVDASAAQGAAQVKATRKKVAATFVLPLDGSLRRAKTAELHYLDTWSAYLDSVAAGGDIGAMPEQNLDADFATVTSTLRSAAPNQEAAQAVPSAP